MRDKSIHVPSLGQQDAGVSRHVVRACRHPSRPRYVPIVNMVSSESSLTVVRKLKSLSPRRRTSTWEQEPTMYVRHRETGRPQKNLRNARLRAAGA